MRVRATTEAQDRKFLRMRRAGWTCRQIAVKHNLATSIVHRAVDRARLQEKPAGPEPKPPALEPLFPIDALTPASPCPHHCKRCSGRGHLVFSSIDARPTCPECGGTGEGPVPRGSSFCCMVCHQSGVEGHPGLRRNPLHEPGPDRRLSRPAPKRTRKQRRASLSLVERIEPSAN